MPELTLKGTPIPAMGAMFADSVTHATKTSLLSVRLSAGVLSSAKSAATLSPSSAGLVIVE